MYSQSEIFHFPNFCKLINFSTKGLERKREYCNNISRSPEGENKMMKLLASKSHLTLMDSLIIPLFQTARVQAFHVLQVVSSGKKMQQPEISSSPHGLICPARSKTSDKNSVCFLALSNIIVYFDKWQFF